MNYQEFKELVNSKRIRDYDEVKVVVQITRGHPAVGASHSVLVTGISQGSDWDQGQVFIRVEEPLTVIDKETETARAFWREAIESYSWMLSQGTIKRFSKQLRQVFDDFLEETGWKDKIEERVNKAKLAKQKAKEARSKTNEP